MFFGDNAGATQETRAQSPMPVQCTVGNLHARFSGNINNGVTSTITIREDGVDTLVTCTVAATTNSCSDTSNTNLFEIGNLISVEIVNSGGLGGVASFSWTATCN